MVASPVPALIQRARRKVIDHLSGVGATSAGKAVSYIPTRRIEQRALAYLQRHGVFSLARGGRSWVDEGRAAEWRSERRTRAAIILGGAFAAAAAVFAFTR